MRTTTLKIHPKDNIEVALADLKVGDTISSGGRHITLIGDVAAKHKFALRDLSPGDDVLMYGVLVGKAVEPIKAGQLITTKNIKHASGDYELRERKTDWLTPDLSKWKDRTFMGFHRADGSVGVSNYWLVIPLVFCENRNVQVIQDAFAKELGYQTDTSAERDHVKQLVQLYREGKNPTEILNADLSAGANAKAKDEKIFPNVDGIKFLNHSLGCAGIKEDTRGLCGLLAGYITHANVAGATVLSLGCQNAQIDMLKEEIYKRDPSFSKPLYLLEQQQIGNEAKLLNQAIKKTFTGLIEADKNTRKPAPLSKLCVGLECGG
ncbi:MAG TPA: UxaA family hydrolase, partial [Mucilaginibacter sp.]|nr:UxaA family hydrolase [Mucilaginibacter sp.]